MDNEKYQKLHSYPKVVNRKKIDCAPQGDQKVIKGHAVFNPSEEFTVIQARKGHVRKNDLSYVLMHKTGIMLRIDLIGATHHGTPTPHVHIFDDDHNEGLDVVPLADIANYDSTFEIVTSLAAFLRYNNFDLAGLTMSLSTV